MKAVLRVSVLIGVLVAVGISWETPALATHATCEALHQQPCSQRPSTHTCTFADGSGSGSCFCDGSYRWVCPL